MIRLTVERQGVARLPPTRGGLRIGGFLPPWQCRVALPTRQRPNPRQRKGPCLF